MVLLTSLGSSALLMELRREKMVGEGGRVGEEKDH